METKNSHQANWHMLKQHSEHMKQLYENLTPNWHDKGKRNTITYNLDNDTQKKRK